MLSLRRHRKIYDPLQRTPEQQTVSINNPRQARSPAGVFPIDEEKCNGCGICAEACHEGGCPKLDDVDYTEKLTAIIALNDIKEVTIVRMEVPCCGGLQRAAENALRASGKFLPWQVVTISRDGRILD